MKREEKCNDCGLPKNVSKSGSITQFINVCNCRALKDKDADQNLVKVILCQNCGKRIGQGRKGSFTQFVFRADVCSCENPSPKDTLVAKPVPENPAEENWHEPKEQLNLNADQFPVDRFLPVKSLGKGANGEVFLALDKLLNKNVAVKTLHVLTKDQLIAFQEEARATSKLSHPYIINILDFGSTDSGTPYMVLEYFNGTNLETIIRKHGRLEWQSLKPIVQSIADALTYAHNSGIYHRDIKPSNILVKNFNSEDLEVKLIDFGIAKLTELTGNLTEYQGMTLAGTPSYMSPDVPMGYGYSKSSEVYSLGCVIFEALTGHLPFECGSALETLSMHINLSPPVMSDIVAEEIPIQASEIVSTCLNKKPEDRYNSMDEIFAFGEIEIENKLPKEKRSESNSPSSSSNLVPISIVLMALICPTILFFILQRAPESDVKDKTTTSIPDENIDVYSKEFFTEPQLVKTGEFSYSIAGGYANNEIASVIGNTTDIRFLEINMGDFSGDSLRGLNELKEMKGLKLRGCQLDNNALRIIAQNMELESLALSGCFGYSNKGLNFISTMNNLESLNLSNTTVEDRDIIQLSKLKKLEILCLTGCRKLTKKSSLNLKNFENLESLSISDSGIETDGIAHLAKLKSLKRLTVSKIPNSLSEALKEMNVYFLTIEENDKITDAEVLKLTEIKSIRKFEFSNCPNLSNQLPIKLKRRDPNYEVIVRGESIYNLKEIQNPVIK